MVRLYLHRASGTGIVSPFQKSIRLVRYGCANRPFYHIVLIETKKQQKKAPIEQLGTYDPLTNVHNEKLVAINFERLQHWLGRGVKVTEPVGQLLGLAGFFPIHPKTYQTCWTRRRKMEEDKKQAESEGVEKESANAQAN